MNNDGYNQQDVEFVNQAIEMAQKSFEEGAFPAGAVLVRNGEVIAKNTSAQWPKIVFHAESKTIDEGLNKLEVQLTDCTLYCSMEPCLMCLSRSYWAGIRKIYYAIRKTSVDYKTCYESNLDHSELVNDFNAKIEMIQVGDLETKTLTLVQKWSDQLKIKE